MLSGAEGKCDPTAAGRPVRPDPGLSRDIRTVLIAAALRGPGQGLPRLSRITHSVEAHLVKQPRALL